MALGEGNLLPPIREALRAWCTIGEVCELLLQAQGKWPEILKKYEIE